MLNIKNGRVHWELEFFDGGHENEKTEFNISTCFMFCSFLMIIRLNAVEKNGFEGTLIGTLVMPYFSGFPNLCFAFLLAKTGSDGAVVLENCLVNNVTNLTILLAIPAMLWGLNLYKAGKDPKGDTKIDHLSLLLSILALIFFTAAVWLVSKDVSLKVALIRAKISSEGKCLPM